MAPPRDPARASAAADPAPGGGRGPGAPAPGPASGAGSAGVRRGARGAGRRVWLSVRLTAAERAELAAKAAASGRTPSELAREALRRTRTWTAGALAVERERTRQAARIGSNLNQIARWANTHKSAAEAVEVVAHLAALERELGELLAGRGGGGAA